MGEAFVICIFVAKFDAVACPILEETRLSRNVEVL